jgi:hypothetical protein
MTLRPPPRIGGKVVGVTFLDNYPAVVYDLERLAKSRVARGEVDEMEPIQAVLVRRPDNPHDANAIEIHVPLLGQMVGHLRRAEAAALAPHLDAGVTYQACITDVVVHPDHPDKPGINIRIERVDNPIHVPADHPQDRVPVGDMEPGPVRDLLLSAERMEETERRVFKERLLGVVEEFDAAVAELG